MRLNLKITLFLLLFFNLFIFGFSESYISEIQFDGDEFVEFYSDYFLNFSDSLLVDDSGKNNSFELIQYVNNSNYYLIVGGNFISSHSLDNLDCTIYKSSGTQVSNGGLKKNGESFSINHYNNSFSFEFDSSLSYNYIGGAESLNYFNNSYVVGSESVCSSFVALDDIVSLPEDPESPEVPDENSSEESSCTDYNFDVIIKEKIVLDKVEFKFDTNYSLGDNYSLKYWIENFDGTVVKNPRNSTSLSWKSYSPKGATQILRVFGELYTNECIFNSSSYVYFYSDYVKTVTKSSSSKSSSSSDEDMPANAYVKLLNIDSVLNLSTDYLKYEIYRGKSRKSVVNFYFNSKVILNVKLGAYEKLSGKVYVDMSDKKYIKVIGLDFDERYNFSKLDVKTSEDVLKDEKNTKLIDKSKQFYVIGDIEQYEDKVLFNIDTNYVALDSVCYVSRVRTKVSNLIYNLTGNVSLDLKVDKLSDYENLKLTCKYKKSGLKSYNYESAEFNFSKDYVVELVEKSISSFNSIKGVSGNLIKKKTNFIDVKSMYPEFGEVIYFDRNVDFIDTSIFFVFIGIILFIIPLLVVW